jgi:DNA-binding winged helix-turn-helix (wHTH) protein
MVKKRSNPSKKPAKSKDKDQKELSPLEEKLLDCAKKGQPVLLYGKDTTATGRKDLILKVHKANGGVDARWGYIGGGEKLKNVKEMFSEMKKAIEDNNHDRVHELLENCKGTSKTWFHLNCGGMNSEEVHTQLVISRNFPFNKVEMTEYLKKAILKYGIPDCLEIEPISEDTLHSGAARTYRECKLFQRDGMLFIDNLSCNPGDINERRFFEKIASLIERRKNRDVDVNGNWLVAYTLNPKDFPSYFIEQFKPMILDSKIEETIEIDYDNKLLKFGSKEEKVEPKQIELHELLYVENKGETVRRKKICEKLWPDYHKTHDQKYPSDIQIDQQVNKLRDGLEELGFEREIIETIKKTQLNKEGGYKFHSNLTPFLK